MVKKASNNHHHCRSFGKGLWRYKPPKGVAKQKILKNYKTLNLEPCDPTIQPQRSMRVECFFNGKTNGPILLKK
jgi:hypothetical protein